MPATAGSARDATSSPEDLAWLGALVRRSPLLARPALRRAWLTMLPWLDAPARYELAAVLRSAELAAKP